MLFLRNFVHYVVFLIDGDSRDEFYIGRDNGNILLARQLDWELQNEYVLNISVTDGVHIVYTQVSFVILFVVTKTRDLKFYFRS